MTESKSVALPLGYSPKWGERWDSNPRMPEPQSGALTASPRPPCYGCWQGWQDSNPRHAVLETAVLPAELHPCIKFLKSNTLSTSSSPCPQIIVVEGEGFEPSKLSQRIYSPPQLATLVPLQLEPATGIEPATY